MSKGYLGLLLFPRRGILRLHNININHPFKNLVMVYLSLQHTCNIGQINVSKTNMWKSIPSSSRSMDQIKLLMVEILNPNSCSVFGEEEPRGEMKIWTASTGSEGRRLVCSRELPATSEPRQKPRWAQPGTSTPWSMTSRRDTSTPWCMASTLWVQNRDYVF